MFGIKDGKIEIKLKDIKEKLEDINKNKIGTDFGAENIPGAVALEIKQEIDEIINELKGVINLSHKLHGMVKKEEEIQRIIDANI